eukprot:gene10597-11718_t
MEEVALTEEDVPGASLSNDPSGCSVLVLKRWLECHGEKRTGKKQDLIDRVRGCISINKAVDPKVDDGKWYELKRERLENNLTSVKLDKSIIPNKGWKVFPSCNIPRMFNYGHIYLYLVESVADFAMGSFTDENDDNQDSGFATTAKPLRKGMNLVKSGFVENIQDNLENDSYHLRAHVHHSMKSDPPLNVAIALSCISGSIKSASCNCRASALGRCAHIAALLLHLNEFVTANGYEVQGPPSIQRILPVRDFQDQLNTNLSAFWHKVFIPEYFEMRVPRRLSPFVI